MILTSLNVFAKELNEEQRHKMQELIQDIILQTHTTLQKENLKIDLYSIDNPEYFFMSNFGLKRAILSKPYYRVAVNPMVFDLNITDDALIGVLAHELIHTEDYESGNPLASIISVGSKFLTKNSHIQYERKTDLNVIKKGYYKELIAYKNWQYPLLSSKALEKKQKEYLTPEEVHYAHFSMEEKPELYHYWKKSIPTNLNEFKLSKLIFENKLQELSNSYISIRNNSRLRTPRNSINKKTAEVVINDPSLNNCDFHIYIIDKNNIVNYMVKKSFHKLNESITIKLKWKNSNRALAINAEKCNGQNKSFILK